MVNDINKNITEKKINNGYIELAGTIVKQVANDYIQALKSKNENRSKKLEKWFLSSYGQLLSMQQGEYIIENCKKIANHQR